MRSRACWGQAGATRSLQPACVPLSCPGLGPTRRLHPLLGLIPWSQHPGAFLGGSRFSLCAPWLLSLGQPRPSHPSCCPETASCQGAGQGETGILVSPQPFRARPVTEARSPPRILGPGCLSLLLPPSKSRTGWVPHRPPGPAQGTFGSQRRSPRLEAREWKTQAGEAPRTLTLSASGTPSSHPAEAYCQPASLEKGTEIKPGFLILTWVVGKGWGVSPSQSQLRPHPSAPRAPTKPTPPEKICDPTFKIST